MLCTRRGSSWLGSGYIEVNLAAGGYIPFPLNKEIKLFADEVNLTVGVQLDCTLPGDQTQLRTRGNDILIHRRVQFPLPGQDLAFPFYCLSPISLNAVQFIFAHVVAASTVYAVRLIILHVGVHIPLGLDPHLLLSRSVLKAQNVGVIRRTILGAAHESHLRSGGRECPRRHARLVVYPAGDDWPVRIAVDKIHHHLVAYAWDLHPAVALACPRAGDAHPARTGIISFRQPVPVELHLHPAVSVRPDALALRPYYPCRLRAVRSRPRGGLRRAEHHRRRDNRKHGRVNGVIFRPAGVAVLHKLIGC